VILPPWWQTWWFRVTLVLAAGGLILLLIRYYIRSKLEIERTRLEKKRAIEKERTRIATDMHDDLGAGLSRIKFLSETIYLKKEMGRPVQDDIRTIGRYAGEMIDKMGEIVWALNEKNDSLNDLLSYTRSYAAEYLMQSGLQCFVESPGEAPCCMLSGEFRRNVYLTIKEALHNIVKHAQARKVVLRMVIDGHLIITIEDDGVGLDPDRARPFGNGLHNMQQRIRDIGGHLLINGNAGTRIYLSVPLP
jgi:signal transduction histidine kinase